MLVTNLGDIDISEVTMNLLKEYLAKQSDRLMPSSLGTASVLCAPYSVLHMKKPIYPQTFRSNYVSPKWISGVNEYQENGGININYQTINLNEKLSKFTEHWSPKVIGEMNDYQFKLVKIDGDFVWHDHQDTDEVFIVLEGEMFIDFRDGQVKISQGEMFIVPRGVEHKTFANQECHIMLVEPRGLVNTGETESELTAVNDIWI
jgi:mannose-6-phosphate isomerase-like protein (cupin superfamily)